MKLSTIVNHAPQGEVPFPTMESIAFQKNDKFGPDLEAIIIQYMDMVKDKTPPKYIEGDKVLKDSFQKLVQDRFGLKTYLITDSHLAATIPNTYVAHSAMLRDAMMAWFKNDPSSSGHGLLAANESNKDIGTVNTETAKISGWLSEQTVPIFMNFTELMDAVEFSSAELTAICLHELGHVFEGAAMANRLNKTNQVIADVARHVSDKGRGGDVNYIFKEISKLDPELKKETIEGLMSGDSAVMGVAAFRVVQGTISSLSGSRSYDRTSFEAMADSFAVRMGYSAPLASGLDKLVNKTDIHLLLGVVSILHAVIMVSLVLSLFSLFKILFTASTAKVAFFVLIKILEKCIGLAIIVGINRASGEDYEYDRNGDRFARIKQNMIEVLKNPKIDKNTRLATLEQIKTIEMAKKNAVDIPNLTQYLLAAVFSSDRVAMRSIAAQKEIEKMIANDIFLAASKLAAKAG